MGQALHDQAGRLPELDSELPERRLSDRILAAFTHAYGCGAKDVAMALLDALECAEAAGRQGRPERRRSNALMQADRWVAFVDARDAYNQICNRKPCKSATAEKALARMKAAYMHWSEAVPAS